ncbi:hypothetical protein GCM10018955_72170 [Planomonospora venezuelensis]
MIAMGMPPVRRMRRPMMSGSSVLPVTAQKPMKITIALKYHAICRRTSGVADRWRTPGDATPSRPSRTMGTPIRSSTRSGMSPSASTPKGLGIGRPSPKAGSGVRASSSECPAMRTKLP